MAIPRRKPLSELIMANETPIEAPSIDNMLPEEYEMLSSDIKERYFYDDRNRIYRMLEPEWLKQRKHWIHYDNPKAPDYQKYTITGSESGTIALASPLMKASIPEGDKAHAFKCKSELWMNKRDVDIPLKNPSTNSDLLFGGHLFEPVALQALEKLWSKDHPEDVCRIVNNCHMYQCGRKDANGDLLFPFALADTDGDLYVNGEFASLVEAKNLSAFSPDGKTVKKGKIPFIYYVQGLHYMFVRNAPSVIFIFAMGNNFPGDFKYVYLERNLDAEKMLIDVETEFIRSLNEDDAPCMNGLDGQDVKKLHDLWRRYLGNYCEDVPAKRLDQSYFDAVEEMTFIDQDIENFKERIKELTEEKQKILVEQIFPVIGKSNEVIVPITETTSFKVQLKPESLNKRLDEEALKRERPDIYEYCCIKNFSADRLRRDYPEIAEFYEIQSNSFTEHKKDYCKIRVVKNQWIKGA